MNNKSLFLIPLFLFLSSTHTIFTMQRSDDPNVLADVIEFARNMPYATGVLLCKDGNIATVTFLNETTAITSAHNFKGRELSAHIVIACDEVDIWLPEYGHSWDLTLQKVKNSSAPWASVERQYSMSKFVKGTPESRELSTFTPEYFSKLRESWEDAETGLSKGISLIAMFDGETYNINGSDISVLKLRTPITLKKKTVKLQAISKNIFDSYKAYGVGFSARKCLNDGTTHNEILHKEKARAVKIPLMCFLAHDLQQSKDGKYAYSKLYSIGGQDEQFIIENLPALDKNRFIGLMMGGMSGGPLLFQISQEEYILGGLNMLTQCPNIKASVDDIISALGQNFMRPNDEKNNSRVVQWQNSIKTFGEITWPIYNIFQLITQEELSFIEKIMAS